MSSLSIIVASSGRPTLARTLESARCQMRDGDELLVAIQTDCPWGHGARNQLMPIARGDALLFIDDDDIYTEGALDAARAAVNAEPQRPHMFRMRYGDGWPERAGGELWDIPVVACGHVSTQMIVAPRHAAQHARWGSRYEGDFDFIAALVQIAGEPRWHERVNALIRP